MSNYISLVSLLIDFENFAEQRKFPEVENIIAKARAAIRKDLQVQHMLSCDFPEYDTSNYTQMHS